MQRVYATPPDVFELVRRINGARQASFQLACIVGLQRRCHCRAGAISAFTRVFDALQRRDPAIHERVRRRQSQRRALFAPPYGPAGQARG